MELDQLFTAYLSKTLNMDQQQVAELVKTDEGTFKSDALNLLLNKNSSHIETLQSKASPSEEVLTDRFNNGYAKAKEEVLTKQENEIKAHYGIDLDLKGLDLMNAVVKEKTKSLENQEITPDAVKRSETYLNMINQFQTEKEEEINKVTNNFQSQINDFKQKETFKIITSAADEIINKLNPVFSTQPAIAQNQRKMIHTSLQSKQFEIKDNGRIVPLNKDNKILENEHGHPVEFDSIVTNITTGLFDLNKSQERKSAGTIADEDNTNQTWTGNAPTNDRDYMKMIDGASTIEEKKAITEAYNKVIS